MTPTDRSRIRLHRRVRAALIAAGIALAAPLPAVAQGHPDALTAAIASADAGSREIRGFYTARGDRPLWVRDGAIAPAAEALLHLIETAGLDGLDPDDYRPRALYSAIERAENGSPKALARAEMLLSRSFAALVRDMRRPREPGSPTGMAYTDAELAPTVPTARSVLERAAAVASLDPYLSDLGWMNPVYARLRRAAGADAGEVEAGLAAGGTEWRLIRLNLDRARALPADPGRRYVLVDAAAARLWMYENGRVQGTMRVVVGKPDEQTPMMAALIRYASLNPYWNIPPDLVRTRVAPGALAQGPAFLKAKRYQVLSDWSENARPIDPATVDWAAVRSGQVDLRVRQLPGAGNAMGRVKFMFPNDRGVYLHDTPEKALLREGDRLFSAGCVRVEDAPRLARWLFGKPLPAKVVKPEQRLDLPRPVPVYITYLTAAAEGGAIVFRPDVYRRDEEPARGARRYAAR